MGAGNFKKQGWEWKREELTVKDQRTNYKILPINKPINNLLNGYSQFETASNGNYI